MTPDERRRIEILEEFARFLPGVAHSEYDQGVAITYRPAALEAGRKREILRQIDRDLRAKRLPPVEIIPLPRGACPTCGMTFGTTTAIATHRARSHH